ncbi:unnamed protein product [Periconia digitata]|uniref:Rhodopsin domain-containing protein n=1 Tax=Periconia digitata TaxID=1303443 RepID=A0A9W4XT98_9PLEO|nr:unnamed protein product [Periconia digitata]
MGLGEHVWNLKDGVLLPLLRTWYVGAVFYIAVIGLLKACVILFYLDIFSTAYPRFRTAAHTILAYITLNTLILVFLTIFACRPIATFWNRDIKGKCLDIPAIGYAVGVSAIVQDIILLVLPLTVIGSLSMDRLRKISAGFLFSIGAFGCIATVLRLHTNPYIKVSLDPTWDYASGMIWVELEVCAIYVCISLPSIRILVVRLLPARCRNLFGKMAERIGDGEHFPQRDAKGGGAAHSPAALPASDQLRSPPRGFFSRILPQTSIWSRFTASGAGDGGSRGLFSTGRNESQVAITRASVDMGEGSAELQESFQLFRKYWNKEMRGGGNEGTIQSQV